MCVVCIIDQLRAVNCQWILISGIGSSNREQEFVCQYTSVAMVRGGHVGGGGGVEIRQEHVDLRPESLMIA